MPERTLAEVATAGKPSMVAGTEEEAYMGLLDVRGPYKVETLYFQQAAANDFKANDTLTSRLAHPCFATVKGAMDRSGTAPVFSVDLDSDESSATFRTITLRDGESIDGLGIVIEIYGY